MEINLKGQLNRGKSVEIEKCKWKYGKQAPVMFMIDDFANKYMTDKFDGNYVGADWGGRCKAANSLYDFLQENIFKEFPYVKMTLFLVVGRREAFIANGRPSVSLRIDENSEFSAFLYELARDERFEIAYHGYTHGKLLSGEDHLTQEWKTFGSLDEACQTIKICKKIYYEVTNKEFYGGKYCGYEYNDFSDESIARSEFEWWCRHWDASLYIGNGTCDSNLDLEEFQGVVDIPSTVDGGLTSIKNFRAFPGRAYFKALYYWLKYGITMENVIDGLVQNGRVINIQEHSSPIREDNKHQKPNLVDDINSILYILRYLKKYDLWYATGHEIAEYWKTYQNTSVSTENRRVIVTTKPKMIGETLWLSCKTNEEIGKRLCLRSETGEIINSIKTEDKILFEVKLKQEQDNFILIML